MERLRKKNRKLVLDDGTVFVGCGFGSSEEKVFDISFSSAMTGYQEIISDPAFINQIVVMAYPVIGNYGVTDEDYESKNPEIGGLVVRDYNNHPSNFRYTKTLSETMEENGIPGISGVDTREIIRILRDKDYCRAAIVSSETTDSEALQMIEKNQAPKNLTDFAGSKKRWYSRTANARYNVVAIDCGIKQSSIRCLNQRRCNITVVPWNTSAEIISSMKPDGIFLSGGPGNPEKNPELIETIKQLTGKYPVMGIGAGHLAVNLAFGGKIEKRPVTCAGCHPFKETESGKIYTAAKSGNLTVSEKALKDTNLEISWIDVISGKAAGLKSKKDRVFTSAFHPEGGPGPDDTEFLFDNFVEMMKEAKDNA